MYPGVAYSPPTKLTAPLPATATVIPVESANDNVLPPAPNKAVIEHDTHSETILYGGKTDSSLTFVTRATAQDDTLRDWPAGATVTRLYTADDQQAFIDNIKHLANTKAGVDEVKMLLSPLVTTTQLEAAIADFASGACLEAAIADAVTGLATESALSESIAAATQKLAGDISESMDMLNIAIQDALSGIDLGIVKAGAAETHNRIGRMSDAPITGAANSSTSLFGYVKGIWEWLRVNWTAARAVAIDTINTNAARLTAARATIIDNLGTRIPATITQAAIDGAARLTAARATALDGLLATGAGVRANVAVHRITAPQQNSSTQTVITTPSINWSRAIVLSISLFSGSSGVVSQASFVLEPINATSVRIRHSLSTNSGGQNSFFFQILEYR